MLQTCNISSLRLPVLDQELASALGDHHFLMLAPPKLPDQMDREAHGDRLSRDQHKIRPLD